MSTGHETAVEAARQGFPAADVLFESVNGSSAVIVLETGSASHSYPYGLVCRWEGSGWVEVAGSNSPAWYRTSDELGVIVFWDRYKDQDGSLIVEFAGTGHSAQVSGGYVLAAIWDVPDPADDPTRTWPRAELRP